MQDMPKTIWAHATDDQDGQASGGWSSPMPDGPDVVEYVRKDAERKVKPLAWRATSPSGGEHAARGFKISESGMLFYLHIRLPGKRTVFVDSFLSLKKAQRFADRIRHKLGGEQ